MSKVHVIHENDAWVEPLRAAFAEIGVPFAEWFIDDGSLELDAEPPQGVFYNRMSASSHTRGHRYAPELKRIFTEYQHQAVDFWLVYADPAETPQTIAKHLQDYDFGWPALRDPGYTLVKRARATVTPEAAVFKADGGLAYHGRIDDRYVDFGKSRLAADKHDLEAAIAATLAGKPVAEPTTRAIGCYLADLE